MARQDKDKGRGRIAGREGLGRLRRAHRQDRRRLGDLARHADDDTIADNRTGHSGADLYNRLRRAQAQHGTVAKGERGEVCGSRGASIDVRLSDGRELSCHVRTVLKKRLRGFKTPLVVGDHVIIDETTEPPVIVDLLPRDNALIRADSHNKALAHVIAANVDALVIVSSLVEPDCRPGLIDRYLLVAALDEIEPIIVFTKGDLIPLELSDELVERYRSIGYTVLVSGVGEDFADTHINNYDNILPGKAAFLPGKVVLAKVRSSTCSRRIFRLESVIFLKQQTRVSTRQRRHSPTCCRVARA